MPRSVQLLFALLLFAVQVAFSHAWLAASALARWNGCGVR
jgi:uncharacterized membrane protein YeiB